MIMGSSSFENNRWTLVDNEDGSWKVTKWPDGGLEIVIQTGDEATCRAYWNTLNEQIIQPGYTP